MKLNELVEAAEAVATEIEKRLAEIEANPPLLTELLKEFFELKNQHAALDAARKRIYHVQDKLDKMILPNALQSAGTDLIRVPEIARSFSLLTKMSASISDKDKGYKWLRDNGHGDLITETVNASTLSAFAKNLLEEQGFELPADAFNVRTYNIIGVNKYNPK